MSTFFHWYPQDRILEFLLGVSLSVALLSSAAWFIARRLAPRPALRHLVLFCGLVACLACPLVTWLCGATDVSIVSVPVLHAPQTRATLAAQRIESNLVFACP